MQLFEMQGLLAGKCLPGDMKVNESLAEYLLRKLEDRNELERQLSAKIISEQNIINAFGIKGEGAHSKLVIEHVMGLVAENHALKSAEIPFGAIENGRAFIDRLEAYPFESQGGDLKMCSDWQSLVQCFDYLAEFARGNDIKTPATNAFTAELRAQGVDALINSIMNETGLSSDWPMEELRAFSANLRAGRKG